MTKKASQPEGGVAKPPAVLTREEAQRRMLIVLRRNRDTASAAEPANPVAPEADVAVLDAHIARIESALGRA